MFPIQLRCVLFFLLPELKHFGWLMCLLLGCAYIMKRKAEQISGYMSFYWGPWTFKPGMPTPIFMPLMIWSSTSIRRNYRLRPNFGTQVKKEKLWAKISPYPLQCQSWTRFLFKILGCHWTDYYIFFAGTFFSRFLFGKQCSTLISSSILLLV